MILIGMISAVHLLLPTGTRLEHRTAPHGTQSRDNDADPSWWCLEVKPLAVIYHKWMETNRGIAEWMFVDGVAHASKKRQECLLGKLQNLKPACVHKKKTPKR